MEGMPEPSAPPLEDIIIPQKQTVQKKINLFEAIESNDIIEVKKALIQNNVDVNSKNASSETPLHAELKKENPNLEIINLLLKYGAKSDISNKYKETPLDLAIEKGADDIIALFIRYGADVSIYGTEPIINKGDYQNQKAIPTSVTFYNEFKNNPKAANQSLDLALSFSSEREIRFLLNAGIWMPKIMWKTKRYFDRRLLKTYFRYRSDKIKNAWQRFWR